MPTLRKSVIVPHPCKTMFDLVERCERYPEFLPWCAAATVLERSRKTTRARLDIDYHGLKTHITTLNRKHAPERIDLEFVDGPFRHFTGAWLFSPLGEEGCRVELSMDYAFDNMVLEALLGRVFGYITSTLVERFVERANAQAK